MGIEEIKEGDFEDGSQVGESVNCTQKVDTNFMNLPLSMY